jgi:hypothetical protein
VIDDSTMTFTLPAALRHAGVSVNLQAQAPLPTARPSNLFTVRVWTSGVRSVDSVFNGPLRGLLADTLRNKVYATRGNELLALDPTTGVVLDSLPLPGTGGSMILGNAAEVLFVKVNGGNLLVRVDPAAWTISRTIAMGTWTLGSYTSPYLATRIIPSNTDPATFLVVRQKQFYYEERNGWEDQVLVFDESIARPHADTAGQYILGGRFFGDTAVLVGQMSIQRMVLDTLGVVRVDSVGHTPLDPEAIVVLSRTRAAANGVLIDMVNGATIAQGGDLSGILMPDLEHGRYFTGKMVEISPGSIGGRVEIVSIDAATGAVLGRIGFGGIDLGHGIATPTGRFFLRGAVPYSGGSPPVKWVNVSSTLTD